MEAESCRRIAGVLVYDPMSLTDDLKPVVEGFLSNQQEERDRRKGFRDGWSSLITSDVLPLMQQAVSVINRPPLLTGSISRNDGVAFSISVETRNHERLTETLTMKPDDDFIYIVCESTIDQPDTTERKHRPNELTPDTIEEIIRGFVCGVLGAKPTAKVMKELGYLSDK